MPNVLAQVVVDGGGHHLCGAVPARPVRVEELIESLAQIGDDDAREDAHPAPSVIRQRLLRSLNKRSDLAPDLAAGRVPVVFEGRHQIFELLHVAIHIVDGRANVRCK